MKFIQLVTIQIVSLMLLAPFMATAQSLSAKEIMEEAEDQWQGEESSISRMTMKILRPTWTRTVKMKNWIKGRDYSLTLITAPANERGQTFLKRQDDMWHWMPSISRLIKLPPSMMSQGWMVVDYHHTLKGEEEVNGYDCYEIKLVPKEGAAIVWGKVLKWISKKHYMQMKSEYYDEDGELIRTELASDVKVMDKRHIPTHIEVIPEDEEGKKTVLELNEMKFNRSIPDRFFSQQNMKRVRP